MVVVRFSVARNDSQPDYIRLTMNARYVLLTAAKDEEVCIEDVIQSVVRQTVRPLAWFIMDDGSTDRTASIIERHAAEHPFIRLQSARARGGRNFGSQYKAIQAAYELARQLDFDFVGVQDADQAPKSENYYESILGEFQSNSRLGIAGGFLYERYNEHGNAGAAIPRIQFLAAAQCSAGIASNKSAVTSR